MSKDHNNDPIKKLKSKVWNLFSGQGNPDKIKEIERIVNTPDSNFKGLINPMQAINENMPEIDEQEKKKIVVVFEKYNQTQCKLCDLNESSAKALTTKLKYLTSITLKELPASGLIRCDIEDAGEYHSLQSRFFGFFKDQYFSLITVWVEHANLH